MAQMTAAAQLEERELEGIADGRTGLGVRSGTIVKRDRLVGEVLSQADRTGVAVLSAPKGFGKTALLLQCISAVQADSKRGGAQLIDAGRLSTSKLMEELDEFEQQDNQAGQRLLAIDDLPQLNREEARHMVDELGRIRSRGSEVVVACTPCNKAFLRTLEVDDVISSRSLTIQPREYSEWSRVFSISRMLDVYDLTQGIPALVSLLQSATDTYRGGDLLEAGVAELYRLTLREMRRDRDALYRPVCMLILMGRGRLEDFTRCGSRVRSDVVGRLAKDFPMFGLDVRTGSFECLAADSSAMGKLRRDVAQRRPAFAARAARILMSAGHVDAAASLARQVLDKDERRELICRFPVAFALAGQASFVGENLAVSGRALASDLEVPLLAALFTSALTQGNYRLARSAAAELRRRADEIPAAIGAGDWACVRAMGEVWGSVNGIGLPDPEYPAPAGDGEDRAAAEAAKLLHTHAELFSSMIGGDGDASWDGADGLLETVPRTGAVSIPHLLLMADRCVDDALHAGGAKRKRVMELADMADELTKRQLVPVASRVRAAVNVCRLLAGEPICDERGFVDAGTTAVRESDLPGQLFCLAAEGWQALGLGQAVNAQFRGQQVVKLAGEGQVFLKSWGGLLERTAHLRSASRMKIVEEAEALELDERASLPVQAWTVALHLAAARFDAELSAWYSLNKPLLLDERFRPLARLAMSMMGTRSEPLRHLLPRNLAGAYAFPAAVTAPSDALVEAAGEKPGSEPGQVVVDLFGGFRVERSGHLLTAHAWRRRKAGVMAARLALARGAFVKRRTIVDELWPDADYSHGRDNLYVTLSSLRAALGQRREGPQYVLTQGDGIALNAEFVFSDVTRFESLARKILLGGTGTDAMQTVEDCLKLEQLYRGPLYVPDSGDPAYFIKMRRTYLAKFCDCMVRGIDCALACDNASCASWLVDAALRAAPAREDIIRRAMKVYDRCGRRREVVELYNSHLSFLKQEANALPEQETRMLYERIINDAQGREML